MVRIGVYVCLCDGTYKDSMDLDKIIEYTRNLPEVVKVTSHDHFCKNDGLDLIKEDITNQTIDRVVMAGCTPINYERFIASTLEEAGLNRYLYEQANIREHSAWIHKEKETATDLARSIISMAIAKSRFTEPLEDLRIEITPKALVIGGGVAGMRTALDLGNKGFYTYLVERESQLGGRTWHLNTTYPTANCGICCMHNCKSCRLTPEIAEIYSNRNIEVLTDSEVTDIKGHIGNYTIELDEKVENKRNINVGTVIIATGSKTFDPNRIPEYGYENEDVVTFLELEQLNGFRKPSDGKIPKVVNFILCVGSRSEKGGNEHCSLVCCNYAIGQAKEIKTLYHDTEVYIHYIDLRAAYRGFEEFYSEARNMGITFLRGRVAKVEKVNDKLQVRAKDLDVGRLLKIRSDLVVLAVGQEPSYGTRELAKITHQKLGNDGFIKDVNRQFRSMEETGIYVAGCAQGPKGIRYSVEDAKIASASAIDLLSKGNIGLSPIKSQVNDTICAGCGTCASLCVYSAIDMVQDHNSLDKKVACVNEATCRGCGICIASCSSGAMEQKGFQNKQLNSMINAFLEPVITERNNRVEISGSRD
jgi:heterodisulfide reductase subunit A